VADDVEWVEAADGAVPGEADDLIELAPRLQAPAWVDRVGEWRRGVPKFGVFALVPAALIAALTFGPVGATTSSVDERPATVAPQHRSCLMTSARVDPTIHPVGLIRYDHPVPGGAACKRPHVQSRG
jgi:hypothetical protein